MDSCCRLIADVCLPFRISLFKLFFLSRAATEMTCTGRYSGNDMALHHSISSLSLSLEWNRNNKSKNRFWSEHLTAGKEFFFKHRSHREMQKSRLSLRKCNGRDPLQRNKFSSVAIYVNTRSEPYFGIRAGREIGKAQSVKRLFRHMFWLFVHSCESP